MTTEHTSPEPMTSPDDTAALFDRMGITVDLEDNVDTSEEAYRDETPDPVCEQATEPAADDADDAVVAEYMQRLLGRTSDTSKTPLPAGQSASNRSSAAMYSTERSGAPPSTSATTPSNGAAHGRAVRQPRKPRPDTVPESSCDWEAMRELANLSARGALDDYSRRQLVPVKITKLMVVVLSLAAGISMALNASVVGMYAWVGASVCWTITVVWGAQFLCVSHLCHGRGSRGKNHSNDGDVKGI